MYRNPSRPGKPDGQRKKSGRREGNQCGEGAAPVWLSGKDSGLSGRVFRKADRGLCDFHWSGEPFYEGGRRNQVQCEYPFPGRLCDRAFGAGARDPGGRVSPFPERFRGRNFGL